MSRQYGGMRLLFGVERGPGNRQRLLLVQEGAHDRRQLYMVRRDGDGHGSAGRSVHIPFGSQPFDDGGCPHAATGAHRHESGGEVAALQLVEERS